MLQGRCWVVRMLSMAKGQYVLCFAEKVSLMDELAVFIANEWCGTLPNLFTHRCFKGRRSLTMFHSQGVCCSDNIHCCPHRSVCNITTGTCDQSRSEMIMLNFITEGDQSEFLHYTILQYRSLSWFTWK